MGRAHIPMVVFLGILWGCAPFGDKKIDPSPKPIENPETLADLRLPDFEIQKMTARAHGSGWSIRVWVENSGGNHGLLEDRGPLDESAKMAAEMRLAMSILECRTTRDHGRDDFVCGHPRSIARTPRMGVPKAGRVAMRDLFINNINPWQIHVMAVATRDGGPVLERDYPVLINNRALLKIVYDPERSSYDPATRTWTWPNDEDSFPY